MLVLKVEIYPYGQKKYKRVLDEIFIINDLTNKRRPEYGNYIIKGGTKKLGFIKDHKREDGKNILIQRVYEEILNKPL